MDTVREAKRESTDIAASRLRKEPSMALYSRLPEVWVPRQRCSSNDVPQTSSNTPIAAKTGQDKSLVMANLGRRLRLELLILKTVQVAVRGHRGRYYQKAIPVDELDLNFVHTTNDEENGDDVDDVEDVYDDDDD